MKETLKHRLPLFIAFGIPTLLIVLVLLFAYLLPLFFINPTHDFIYTENQFVGVESNKLIVYPCTSSDYYCNRNRPSAYLYDVSNKERIPLSQTDFSNYTLDISSKSPDGYEIVTSKNYSSDFFFLFGGGRRDDSFSIKKGLFQKNISIEGRIYNFKFLGWVTSIK